MVLLFDTGMAVAVAVEEVAGDGDRTEVVDDGGDAELEHLVGGQIAAADVRGGLTQVLDELVE